MFRAVRSIARFTTIARTLARHDALFPLEGLGLSPFLLGILKFGTRKDKTTRPGQRLALALEKLGPTFIKLGQMLSTRPDLVGEVVAADLSALQDHIPAFPYDEARRIIEQELGGPLEHFFSAFEEAPHAAASIAQVHFATTTNGNPVAVKVRRPDVEAAFARDLDLFYWAAEWVERVRPHFRRLKPREVVATFAEQVAVEMDFRLEAAAATELGENFAADPTFRVPKIDWERTGRRILTSERIYGIPIDEREQLIAAGHDPNVILANAARVFFAQVFRDGFFHADQHPGNAFVDKDGVIVAIDFGIMGRIDRQTRAFLADMMIGFLRRDYRLVAEVHFRAGFVPAHKSIDAFTQALRAIAEPIMDKPLHEISIAKLLGLLFQTTETFEMETQPQLLLLQKTMLVTEGVGRSLNPDVNMWTMARPMIEEWMRAFRGPEARLIETARSIGETLNNIPTILANAQKALAKLADADFHEPRRIYVRIWPVWISIAALAVAVLVLAAR